MNPHVRLLVGGSVCHNFLKRYAFIATRCSGKIFNIIPPPPLPPECRALLFVTRKWRANYSWCIMLAPNLLEVITSLVWNFGHPVYGLTEKQYFLYWPWKDKFPYYHAYDQSFQQRAFIKCLLLQKFGKENVNSIFEVSRIWKKSTFFIGLSLKSASFSLNKQSARFPKHSISKHSYYLHSLLLHNTAVI